MEGIPRDSAVGSSILETIGNTPVVELSRVTAGPPGRLFAKLDYLNPGGSKKDRIALRLVEDAEGSGTPDGQTVVELTSGNTGAGRHRLRGAGVPLRRRHGGGQYLSTDLWAWGNRRDKTS